MVEITHILINTGNLTYFTVVCYLFSKIIPIRSLETLSRSKSRFEPFILPEKAVLSTRESRSNSERPLTTDFGLCTVAKGLSLLCKYYRNLWEITTCAIPLPQTKPASNVCLSFQQMLHPLFIINFSLIFVSFREKCVILQLTKLTISISITKWNRYSPTSSP